MYTYQPVSLSSLFLIPAIGSSILHALPVSGYIPAQPVNDTSGLNFTDSSIITITWVDPGQPNGVFSGPVSYQLEADVRTGGTTRGALVHFAESSAGVNLTTTTPWIAYISCDYNESIASQEWDIITLARDRGAVSALLYSATSESCLINQEYIQDFEKPLDVFATKTKQTARVIDSQFDNTNATFYTYDGRTLNASGTAVNMSLIGMPLANQTYLTGTLTARNSTGQATATGGIPSTPSAESSSRLPAGLIAAYSIVGIVSGIIVLFFLCFIRRLVSHPERYGRRDGDESQGGRTRAKGVAQALLDTFPVVKFRQGDDRESGLQGAQAKRLCSHGDLSMVAMPALGEHDADGSQAKRWSMTKRSESSNSDTTWKHDQEDDENDNVNMNQSFRRSVVSHSSQQGRTMSASSSRRTSGFSPTSTPLPEATDGEDTDEHCPICLLEFEIGDDVRVLPCEREHRYHQACIDPWLLSVSSSCPLCRKDFNNPNPSPPVPDAPPSPTTPQPTASGFAKYLAFMRRERGNSERQGRRRAGTGGSRSTETQPRRRREADQTGPGGY